MKQVASSMNNANEFARQHTAIFNKILIVVSVIMDVIYFSKNAVRNSFLNFVPINPFWIFFLEFACENFIFILSSSSFNPWFLYNFFLGEKCPPYAFNQPVFDEMGLSKCLLRTDSRSAYLYLKREGRFIRNKFC